MKKILLLLMFLNASTYADFDFKTCSGSGSFEQQIKHYHGDYENAINVGTIPKGIKDLQINLISDKDVDIRLYAKNGDKIVHWPHGILTKSDLETKPYKKTNITYSGYNGVAGEKGNEFIEINGTLSTDMTMKAFGYKAGYATVNYSWRGKEGCTSSQNGSDTFTQKILKNKTSLVGTIPVGIENLNIKLTSEKDIDIQLYGKDGTPIVSWKPKGLISGPNEQNITHNNMNIFWSGYNGTDGKKGHEYIKIPNKTSEVLTMRVFGYEAGTAKVTYDWGDKGTCIVWYDGCNDCTLTEDNQTICTKRYCQVYGENKCTKWKDSNISNPNNPVCGSNILIDCPESNQTCNLKTFENLDTLNQNTDYTFIHDGECKKNTDIIVCTQEYAPVCGITNPCPTGAQCLVAPIYKTFSNMCMLNVAKAQFIYEGECAKTYETTIIIKPKKVNCTDSMVSDTKCMQVQEESSDVWETVSFIKNFTYQEEYQYKIRVKVTNTPIKSYELIEILKKNLVDD